MKHPSLLNTINITVFQVAKQWYNYERPTFHFVRVAHELQTPLTFRKVSDFDKNGIIYWIGSNARWGRWLHTAHRIFL